MWYRVCLYYLTVYSKEIWSKHLMKLLLLMVARRLSVGKLSVKRRENAWLLNRSSLVVTNYASSLNITLKGIKYLFNYFQSVTRA